MTDLPTHRIRITVAIETENSLEEVATTKEIYTDEITEHLAIALAKDTTRSAVYDFIQRYGNVAME